MWNYISSILLNWSQRDTEVEAAEGWDSIYKEEFEDVLTFFLKMSHSWQGCYLLAIMPRLTFLSYLIGSFSSPSPISHVLENTTTSVTLCPIKLSPPNYWEPAFLMFLSVFHFFCTVWWEKWSCLVADRYMIREHLVLSCNNLDYISTSFFFSLKNIFWCKLKVHR